ncbi:DUF2306 domain-containing protein [Pendulispora albinea]|uniref:DUF2306 domain-containing protein n=1 Tax=Pendulispora albinea TaxID=2741071 RepID=A0ABZ2MB48_9BACT
MNVSRRTNSRPLNALRMIAGVAVMALSTVFVYRALRLFSFDPDKLGRYFSFKWIIMGHVLGGTVALFTGPFQLWKAFRVKYWRAHRIMGRIYLAAIGAGASCALILASTTARSVGWPYALSLHMLATVWLASALLAWRTAVTKRFKLHEEWATRSYIATLAFVVQSFSFEIPFVAGLGAFAEVSPTIMWFSWTVPMFAYAVSRATRA